MAARSKDKDENTEARKTDDASKARGTVGNKAESAEETVSPAPSTLAGQNPWDKVYGDDEQPPRVDREGKAVDDGGKGYIGTTADNTPNKAYTVEGVLNSTEAADADAAVNKGQTNTKK